MYLLTRKLLSHATILLLFGLSFLFYPSDSSAEGEVKIWPVTKLSVPADKIWTIKFNSDLNFKDVTENVIVKDSKGNRVNVSISKKDSNQIVVEPPAGGYKSGELYDLYISNNLKSSSNAPLHQPVSMRFKIDQDDILEMSFKQKINEIDSHIVTNVDNNTMTIENTDDNHSILKGDMIKLPPSEKNPLGEIKKVTSMEKSGDTTVLTTEIPTFDEIIEDMELYQRVSITADHVTNVPENVTIKNTKVLEIASSKGKIEPSATFHPIQNIKGKMVRDSEGIDAIEVEFNHFLVKTDNDLPIYIDGKLIYKKPEVVFDKNMKNGKLERLNMALTTVTQEQLTVSLGVRGDFSLEDIHKDVVPDYYEEEIELGDVTVPIGTSGLGARVKLGFFLKGDFKGNISTTISRNSEITLGGIAENGKVTPIFHADKDLGFFVGGKGESNLSAGGFLNAYLVLANVLSAGVENSIGLYTNFQVKAGLGSNLSINTNEGIEVDPSMACYKYEPGSLIQSNLVANLEVAWLNYEKTLLNIVVVEDKNPFAEYVKDTCLQLEDLSVPKEIVLEPGEKQKLSIFGTYYDHYDMLNKYEDLKKNDKWKYIHFESSNPSIVEVVDNTYVKAVATAKHGEKSILKIRYKEGELEKTAEIPIIIHSTLVDIPPITPEEIIENYLEAIDEDDSDKATDRFYQALEPYKKRKEMTYGEEWVPTELVPEVRLEILEQTGTKIKIKTIELADESYKEGSHLTLTAIYDKGKWLIDYFEVEDVISDGKPFNLTLEEAIKVAELGIEVEDVTKIQKEAVVKRAFINGKYTETKEMVDVYVFKKLTKNGWFPNHKYIEIYSHDGSVFAVE